MQTVRKLAFAAMWRQAALALNGTAGIQASEKGPSSYTAQLPTPTGRSVQQGGTHSICRATYPIFAGLLVVLADIRLKPSPLSVSVGFMKRLI